MFRFWIPFASVALCTLGASGQDAPANAIPTPSYKTTIDQASYGIGINIGSSLLADELDINAEALIQGIRDALADAEPRLTRAQMSAALAAFQKEMQVKAAARAKVTAEKNVREGKAFLDANKKKQGVKTLPSGLQYTILKQGNGPTPKVTDRVRTHYHGTLIDGTVFDSTVESEVPAEFAVGGVIRAWTEALQMMQVGSKWRLYVPSDLGYGPGGFPPDIGPHAVLIFEVELLGIL